jgi:hypothetical protein
MARAPSEQGDAATMGANSRGWSRPPLATHHEHVFFSAVAILLLGNRCSGICAYQLLSGRFSGTSAKLGDPRTRRGFFYLDSVAPGAEIFCFGGASGRVDLHRRLGMAGSGFGCWMIVPGTCAATDAERYREHL